MVPFRNNTKEINAADVEHLGSLVIGGLLVLKGTLTGGVAGFLYKTAGAGLIFRGQQGYRRLYDLAGIPLPRCASGIGRANRRVAAEIIVHRDRSELYRIWRNLENLPVFMDHLLSVHELDDRHSLWVAKAPAGMVVKWESEIINDIENEKVAWQSLEGSGVDNAGSVTLQDLGSGNTLITVVIRYDPPGELVGVAVAKLFRNDPQRQIEYDLRRFKAIMELEDPTKERALD